MEIQWLSNTMQNTVSIYETNITLNKVAASNFIHSYATLIGFDRENNTLIIKSLNKEDATSGLYKESDLHPISVKATYGRINGKNIIRNISSLFPLDFSVKTSYKYKSEWDEISHSLIIYLKEEIK